MVRPRRASVASRARAPLNQAVSDWQAKISTHSLFLLARSPHYLTISPSQNLP